ncbi:Mobile element protein [Bacillus badius]|uniref:Mobile element protein n=1 Tax=Bacillus badius TaxID=1455 RepID=A0ABR5AP66_BACBA|nr:Mobile element protein [Bacillus badius]KIL74783.1 Mobile element protein [Bacillus badius]
MEEIISFPHIPLSIDWGKVFGDDVPATAILDRLLHHAVTFNIKGNFYSGEIREF